MTARAHRRGPAPRSRWDTVVWPRWLPARVRLPLVAQIAGVCALLAALAMPRWSTPSPASAPRPASSGPQLSATAAAPQAPPRPAYLNLDVRHTFGGVDLTVSVDGERVLDARLPGAGKRFGVFGKRGERGFTRTLDLAPGTRVVRIRLRSTDDKFDQTRVERFDLGPASVASIRAVADRSGLSLFADRPPAPAPVPAAFSAPATALPPAPARPSAADELYRSLRSVLIAIAGFVASAATGFVVQEFLRGRKGVLGL